MIESRSFGVLPTGAEARLFSLTDGVITIRVTDLGATVVGIDAPDASGALADVVLGYDDASAYFPNTPYFFGATVGPSANRVERSEVPINGTMYLLPVNENGNNLHTDHENGIHAQIWRSEVDEAANAVSFTCNVEDGAYGLPGNRSFTVRYELADAVLRATYEATTDAPTFFNLTNHAYFNMRGQGTGSVREEQLTLHASRYLPISATSIPTGELRPVDGTAFDFRHGKLIGQGIAQNDEQLLLARGYDHCFCIDGYDASQTSSPMPRPALRLVDEQSGRGMELWTSLPGLQVYTGNFLDENHGKAGATYREYDGVALEPQFYPATPSHANFPQAIFDAEHPYRACNEYRFFTTRHSR